MTEPVTVFPNGVSDSAIGSFASRANLPLPDPSKVFVYFDDFNYFDVGQWDVVDNTGARGSAALTQSLARSGGYLQLATGDQLSDIYEIDKLGRGFLLELGKQFWMKVRCSMPIVTDVLAEFGLSNVTTDAVVFTILDGSVNFVMIKNSGVPPTTAVNLATLAADEIIELGMHFDGAVIRVYVNDNEVAELADLTDFPEDEVMTPSFDLQTLSAAAKQLQIDYFMAIQER